MLLHITWPFWALYPQMGGYLQPTRQSLVVELLVLNRGILLLVYVVCLGWTGVSVLLTGGYPKAYRQKVLKKCKGWVELTETSCRQEYNRLYSSIVCIWGTNGTPYPCDRILPMSDPRDTQGQQDHTGGCIHPLQSNYHYCMWKELYLPPWGGYGELTPLIWAAWPSTSAGEGNII